MTSLDLLELEYQHAFELVKEKHREYEQAKKYLSDVSMVLLEEYAKIAWPEEE